MLNRITFCDLFKTSLGETKRPTGNWNPINFFTGGTLKK